MAMQINQTEIERNIIFAFVDPDRDEQQKERILADLEPEHFTINEARKIFVIASALYAEGNGIGDLAMIEPRTDQQTSAFLLDICAARPFFTSEQINKYISELHRLKRCRDAAAATRAALKALEEGDESAIYELQNRLEKDAAAGGSLQLVPLSDAVSEALTRMGDKHKNNIKTGFSLIDNYFSGIEPGRLAILAAVTGAGKSAFAANLAWNVAKSGGTVLYVSLEMPEYRIASRIIANITGIDKRAQEAAVKNCDLKTLERITEANELIKGKKIFLHAAGNAITTAQIQNLIRQTRAIYGACNLVIVDYLQLLQPQRKTDTREREVANFSKALANISIKEDTCIFALSQVNRQVDGRSGNRLYLSDIRESAAPTQDAAGVFFLYQDDGEEKAQDICHYTIEIAKSRDDALSMDYLIFNKPLQRFTDATRE